MLPGNPAAAAEQARAILADRPDATDASVLLASAERMAGSPETAIDILSVVIARHPDHARAVEELGMARLAARRTDQARNARGEAGLLDRGPPAAGSAPDETPRQHRTGSGRQQADSRAGQFDLIRAADALMQGKPGDAERLCRDVLRREPQNASAIRMLAETAIQFGRFDDAAELLAYCLQLAPDFHLARHDYAKLLFKMLRFRDALRQIDRVLEAEPDHASHQLLKATVLLQSGSTDEAILIYDKLERECATDSRSRLGRGHALKTAGRQADAVKAYRAATELPGCAGEAYWSLANLKTFSFEDADISRMRERLDRSDVSPEDFVHLSFALGKALEDRRLFDESFRHYANGNAGRRRTVSWDADLCHTEIETIADCFRQDFLASRRDWGNASVAPIFIVGLPRSGSTLLEQILASHSQVEGTTELPDIMSMVARLGRVPTGSGARGYPDILATLGKADFEALGAEYLARTAEHRSGATRFIDKMPNNFAHVGFIHLILPNATILDARRSPMACCFGIFKQLFANGQYFSYRLEEIGRYYGDYVRLMSHWDAVLPGRVCRVDYESVVRDTETEVRRVLDHCGLDYEPACLAFHRTARAVRTASSEQVRMPIYGTAVEHWRHYESHLGPLRNALGSMADPP